MPADEWARRAGRLTRTTRFRVTALAFAVLVATLAAGAAGLVLTHRRLLTGNLDDGLRQRADDLAVLLAVGAPPATLPSAGVEDTLVQIVTIEGQVIAASANVAGYPPLADAPPDGVPEILRSVRDIPVDDDVFRVLSRRIEAPDGTRVVHVAESLDEVVESAGYLQSSLLLGIPAVALLAAAATWWLVGRTLRPVEAIRAEVAGIGGKDLHRRVPEPGGDDEIARLARTMNAMLERVGTATARQQRFVADASHELRSPLARMRAELEVDITHPATADPQRTLHSVLEEIQALANLVDDLLHLARSDAGAALAREPVDLDDVVLREAAALRARGPHAVDTTRVSAARVLADRDQLVRVVRNLAENAIRHAASTITLTLAEHDGIAQLTVADDGPGIPEADRARIFERFARLDDARTTTSGGAGLGLAIVRDVVARHGGTVEVDESYRHGARFVVTLPATA